MVLYKVVLGFLPSHPSNGKPPAKMLLECNINSSYISLIGLFFFLFSQGNLQLICVNDPKSLTFNYFLNPVINYSHLRIGEVV